MNFYIADMVILIISTLAHFACFLQIAKKKELSPYFKNILNASVIICWISHLAFVILVNLSLISETLKASEIMEFGLYAFLSILNWVGTISAVTVIWSVKVTFKSSDNLYTFWDLLQADKTMSIPTTIFTLFFTLFHAGWPFILKFGLPMIRGFGLLSPPHRSMINYGVCLLRALWNIMLLVIVGVSFYRESATKNLMKSKKPVVKALSYILSQILMIITFDILPTVLLIIGNIFVLPEETMSWTLLFINFGYLVHILCVFGYFVRKTATVSVLPGNTGSVSSGLGQPSTPQEDGASSA